MQRLADRFPRSVVNAAKYYALSRAIGWNLDALAVLWGSDKAPGHHGYTARYRQHLHKARRGIRCVLEIGIGGEQVPGQGGNSLFMWKSYFPLATVYGLDIYEKRLRGVPGIVALQADQSDPVALRRLIETCPSFDLVIDDGSHIGRHIATSFDVLFPTLNPGGWYVIEDLETAYQPAYEGGPPGTPATSVSLIKALLDEINVGPRAISAIHVYPGIVFIQKSLSGG